MSKPVKDAVAYDFEEDASHHMRTIANTIHRRKTMNEVEQDGLLEEAKLLLEEAAKEFFDGDIGEAAYLAHAAYVRAANVRDANPTRGGIGALVSRLRYLEGALEHFVGWAEREA